MGVSLMIALIVLSLLLSLTLHLGAGAGLVAASVMLLACGFLVAALFAYASLHERPDQRATISPLYASDLLGGCLGSLAAALLLIPGAGLAGSASDFIQTRVEHRVQMNRSSASLYEVKT
jgi:hypothetical protein